MVLMHRCWMTTCAHQDCDQDRVTGNQGQESYCRQHKNELARAIRNAGKGPEVVTTVTCQRVDCDTSFEVSSWGQAQKFCSAEHRNSAPKAARAVARVQRQAKVARERAEMTERHCPGLRASDTELEQVCGVRPIEEFYSIKGRPDTLCKDHRKAQQRRYEKADPERRREQARRSQRKSRWSKFLHLDAPSGEWLPMTEADYTLEFAAQQGRCKLADVDCPDPDLTSKRPDVDHDHQTMRFRGLLCHSCNLSIHDRHTATWHRGVAAYLEAEPVASEPQWVQVKAGA
jgi:hypothetical protein